MKTRIDRRTACFRIAGNFPIWENLLFGENMLCFRVIGTFPERENGRKHENRPAVDA